VVWESTCRCLRLALTLQLHSLFQMGALCGGLMGASPQRPGDDMSRLNAPLR
jgi:hypothetical protein